VRGQAERLPAMANAFYVFDMYVYLRAPGSALEPCLAAAAAVEKV